MIRAFVIATLLSLTPLTAFAADYRSMQAVWTHPDNDVTFRVTIVYGSGTSDVYNFSTVRNTTDLSFHQAIQVDRSRRATISLVAIRNNVLSISSNAFTFPPIGPVAPVLKSVQ